LTESLKEFVFQDPAKDGLFYVGHASALARISGQYILFDPMWNYSPYGDKWLFSPEQIDCDEILEKLSGCIVSHCHSDHVCPPALSKMKIPITIKDGRLNLKTDLEKYRPVNELAPFVWHPFLKDLEIYFVPHAFNSIDSSVFVRSKTYCVYIGSDNFLTRDLIEKIKPDIPWLDVACVPTAFIHWYPHRLQNISEEERVNETARLNSQSIDQALMFCNHLKPRAVIPFGSSLFYYGGANNIINRSLTTPFDFQYSTAKYMFAGDYILSDGRVKYRTLEKYYQNMLKESLGEMDESPLELNFKISSDDLGFITKKVQAASKEVAGHDLIINDVVINLGTKEVRFVPDLDRQLESNPNQNHYTRFRFDRPVFEQLMRGEISFDGALGTRRFECVRSPNIYRLEVFEWFNNFL